ncbi:MAG: 50S ribosomal protein L23 [Luteibaculaceae bacterium]
MESLLIRPIITEKMTAISEKLNKYSFVVPKSANKVEIKKAIEAQYGVKVVDVNTMIQPGKKKIKYTKTTVQKGRTSAYKKAVVTLVEGDVIDIYSNL